MILAGLFIGYALGLASAAAAWAWRREKPVEVPKATIVAYGNWTRGYLLNESSGNLSATFGPPSKDH